MTTINLTDISHGTGGFVIQGDNSYSVASIGDINGDGLTDIVIGVAGASKAQIGLSTAGQSYVIFGKTDNTAIKLSAIAAGTGGFVINGEVIGDMSGFSVSSAGDINGDGFDDILIGAPEWTVPKFSGYSPGSSYVVFGKSTTNAVDLSTVALGNGGFSLQGTNLKANAGYSVSAAGDVNGDGFADLIIGEPTNPGEGGLLCGRSYVLFGQSDASTIAMSSLSKGGGFFINNTGRGYQSGHSVSAAGDINGDGLADLIVGAPYGNTTGNTWAGRSYVIFGKTSSATTELSAIAAGKGGFVINGQCAQDSSGWSVSSAGDVNGDGLADLIVGTHQSFTTSSLSYVVFGKTGSTAVNLSAVANGSGGFVIAGKCTANGWSDYTGINVSSAGDINGDGLNDLIVGSKNGTSYVVFGKTDGIKVNVTDLTNGNGGFLINAEYPATSDVAAAGDINGDGLADLLLSNGDRYVIFGSTTGAFAQTAVDQMGGSGDDTLTGTVAAETLVGGAGKDTLIGNGGADVLYGGAGDDTFIVNADNIAALSSGIADGNYARIDGGTGIDTLSLAGSGIILNLAAIANQGAAAPGSASRIESIERIDLTGSNNNSLTLTEKDVVDMAGMNLFNSGSGWSGLTSSVQKHQLVITGDAGDRLGLGVSANWSNAGTTTHDAKTYTVYNSKISAAQILVDQAVSLNNSPTGAVLIAGTVTVDKTLTASNTLADIDGLGTISYQWQADGVAINGATASTYTLTATEVDKTISVTASYTDGLGIAEHVTSDATGKVAGVVKLSTIATGSGGFVINGQSAGDHSGVSVASAGDVNGDGLNDLIVGANYADPGTGLDAGRSYLVFGQTGTTSIELSAIAAGNGGFVINGQGASDHSGTSVAAAGDINGDGLADLIVGAPKSDPGAGVDAGRSYVIFGKTTTAAIELSAVTAGSGGFVINGQSSSNFSGISVAAAGDVNGDGLADLIVGAYKGDPTGAADAGRSYVLFGRSSSFTFTDINLSDVANGTGGFVINGQVASDLSGISVSTAGDVNGDGLADLIVGASKSNPTAGADAGRSYVVFGHTGTTAVNLSAVAAGNGGFVINGQGSSNFSGISVAASGDVNGDGLADLIVGAYKSDPTGAADAGRSYVVFGTTAGTAINLSAVAAGSGGFVIVGECAGDLSGRSVSCAGDINGDGLADLIVGAYKGDPAAGTDAGRSYVVFGTSAGTAINLSNVSNGNGGFVITGQCAGDFSGCSVSTAGDVNGDGLADLIVGARTSDPIAGADAGRSYVIFGNTSGAFNASVVDQLGGSGNDILTGTNADETLVGGTGNDTLTGNGGADVLYGGAGDDSFILNAGNIAALSSGISNGHYARIDGGCGVNSLVLDGANLTLDLTAIPNQGGASPAGSSRIESIERIDLTGSGNNSVTLSANDVVDTAGMNLFNRNTGWTPLAALIQANTVYFSDTSGAIHTIINGYDWPLIAPVLKHQLIIDGNPGDTVTLTNPADWSFVGGATYGGEEYNVYNSNTTAAQVIVHRLDVLNFNELPTGTVTITGDATQNKTLTATNTLADPDGLDPKSISYQWRANGQNIAGATGDSYVLTEAEVDKLITVVASYTDGHGTKESVASSTTHQVINVNDAPTGTLGISGIIEQNQVITVANTVNDPDGLGTFHYQWLANGTAIFAATGASYTLTEAEVGKTISVTASYVDGHGTTEKVTSVSSNSVANVNDAPTGTVTISGTAEQKQMLTGSDNLSDADGLGPRSYQWQADGQDIAGATGKTYTLTEAEVGKTISVVASYTDGHGTKENVASADTDKVLNVNDDPTGQVTISGEVIQNASLTAHNTLDDPDGLGSISYKWLAAGIAIPGAAGDTFKLTENEVGKAITVAAGYTDGHGTQETVSSAATGKVVNVNDDPTGSVEIVGTLAQNETLHATNTLDDPDGLGTISYQWQANGTNINGAIHDTHTLTEAEVGKTISVIARYTDGHGTKESVSSAATNKVENINDKPTGNISISGILAQGQTLTANNLLADADGMGTVSYQWQADGQDIAGATNASYTLTAAETRKTIAVVGHYIDGHGTPESVASASTKAVKAIVAASSKGVYIGSPEDEVLMGGLKATADKMSGGAGDDDYVVDNKADKVIENPDQGNDSVYAGIGYTLGSDVENLTLTGAANINATGNILDNILTGNASNNILTGNAGNDSLYGGSGNDVLIGGTGDDILQGADGNDIYLIAASTEHGVTENINDTAGNLDEVRFAATAIDTLVLHADDIGIERVIIGTGTAAKPVATGKIALNIDASAVENALTIIGNAGANSLTGSRYDDVISGGQGNDTLNGGDGNDKLDGGSGDDTMSGGAGDDTYLLNNLHDSISEQSDQGTDTIQASINFSLAGIGNVENLTLIGKAIKGTGNDQRNIVTGNAAANILDGGADDDQLNGGLGNDRLTGGNGDDVFIFDTALKGNLDTITDFELGKDHLRLNTTNIFKSLAIADADSDGILDSQYFHSFAAGEKIKATAATDYLLYDGKTGALYYDADGSGSGAAVKFVVLTGAPALTTEDIMLG